MERAKYLGEDAARKDLGTPPSKPAWLECQHGLPFEYLSPDEFEAFCYLLLLQENPGEEIWYYGKTGDAGRDIIRKRGDGSIELIQCKRYRDNVGFPEVKTELAKLCVNIDNKTITERPDRVTFYVAVQELPESDEIEIALQYERAIESFLRWLPEVTDPPR